jgi:hypothetical protein
MTTISRRDNAPHRGLRRAGAGALVAVALVLATAGPAAAHTVSGTAPTNYQSQIVSVAPKVSGVSLRLLDLGRKVELTNTGSDDIVVLGYNGEPYLRVGPTGVFENRRSPAVYLNQTANQTTTKTTAPPKLPPQADAAAPPEWQKTSDNHYVRWHDRRTRWEGADPPAVRAAPDQQHLVGQWTIPMRSGTADRPVVATGRINWVPGPSAVPWLLAALGLFALTVSLAWRQRWGPPLAGALAVLIAVDAVYSFASGAATGDAVVVTVLKVVGLGFISTLAWIGGIWAIGRLQRQHELGLLLAGMSGFVIGLYSLGDTIILGRSQVAYIFPAAAARAAVSVSMGVGVGLVVAVVLVFKHHPGLIKPASES